MNVKKTHHEVWVNFSDDPIVIIVPPMIDMTDETGTVLDTREEAGRPHHVLKEVQEERKHQALEFLTYLGIRLPGALRVDLDGGHRGIGGGTLQHLVQPEGCLQTLMVKVHRGWMRASGRKNRLG